MAAYNQKVVHLQIGNEHYYFGSLKALSDNFPKEKIGLTYDSLRHVKLSAATPYTNKLCTIRIGVLVTTPKENREKRK